MKDVNRVVLIGRLTRDAELKYTPDGQALSKFSIAVNRRKKNGEQWEDEPNYFDIVIFNKKAENIHQYLVKGKAICVDGELRQERWQQDGQNRSRVGVIAEDIQLLSFSQQREGQESSPEKTDPPPSVTSDDGFTDDIPF